MTWIRKRHHIVRYRRKRPRARAASCDTKAPLAALYKEPSGDTCFNSDQEGHRGMDSMSADKQLEFAANAVRRYRQQRPLEAAGAGAQAGVSGGNKRHIVNVDDTSRINYEMVKNTPGNLPAVGDADAQDAEITGLKTRMYKGQLYRMNDEYLEQISSQCEKLATSGVQAVEAPLEDQYEWLRQIRAKLVEEYHGLVNEEKKWIVLKELLLDANTELDLYSAQHPSMATIKLGSVAVPTNSNANALVFNRAKRQKIKNSGYYDDISPVV